MVTKICNYCKKEVSVYPSRAKKDVKFHCSKSCLRSYQNTVNNPSWSRDLSGENNPMYGKHIPAWNKGIMGDECHNWKGGVHKRKDGYVRININGERKLLHRHLLGVEDKKKVVHHKDHNPSNNSIENLMIFDNQSEHVRFEKENAIT